MLITIFLIRDLAHLYADDNIAILGKVGIDFFSILGFRPIDIVELRNDGRPATLKLSAVKLPLVVVPTGITRHGPKLDKLVSG